MGQEWISIGQLAHRAGVSVSAIRFYEARGLLSSVRSEGGHRQFRRSDIRRLSFVLIAQQFGFSLSRIRDWLGALPDERTPTKRDWKMIGRGVRQELDIKIARLVRMREKLDGCIGCGCLSLKNCHLYNPGDRAAKQGSGPRYVLEEQTGDSLPADDERCEV